MKSKTLNLGFFLLALLTVSLAGAQEKTLEDALKKVHVPDQERLANHKKKFKSFDANNDNIINYEEFKSKKREKVVSKKDLKKRFAKMDLDDNGKVTLKELSIYYSPK